MTAADERAAGAGAVAPAFVVPATCSTCRPWVRMVPTATMHLVRQELHEPHCPTVPKLQRAAV